MGESSVRPRLPFNSCSSLELDPPISAAEGGPTSKLSCNKREAGFFVCTYPATRQKVGREKVFPPLPRSQKESFKFANCPSPPPLFPHGLALKMEGWGGGVVAAAAGSHGNRSALAEKKGIFFFLFFFWKVFGEIAVGTKKRGRRGEGGVVVVPCLLDGTKWKEKS